MTQDQAIWHALSVTVQSSAAEAVELTFNILDSRGTSSDLLTREDSNILTITGYFDVKPETAVFRRQLENLLSIYGLGPETIAKINEATIENQDWLAEWKKYWKPVEIGRFVIAAPWHEVETADKTLIRIEPNMAFGTGTHETTKLCLAAIGENYRPGMSFLDIGTGTGILAIAAAKLSDGSERIAGIDTDPDAVAIARTNAELNGVADRIEFSTGSVEAVAGRFEIICANLTADVITPLLSDLVDRTGVKLVLAGILAEQEKMVLDALRKNLSFNVARAGEWIAIILEKRF